MDTKNAIYCGEGLMTDEIIEIIAELSSMQAIEDNNIRYMVNSKAYETPADFIAWYTGVTHGGVTGNMDVYSTSGEYQGITSVWNLANRLTGKNFIIREL